MCQGGQGNFNMQQPGFTPGGANDPAQGGSGYYGGGQGNSYARRPGFSYARRPGFVAGGPDDPAQGGTGYYRGGSASWGGNYGNQINSGYGNGWGTNPFPGAGNPWNPWNAFGSGSYMGTGTQNQGMNYNNTQDASTALGNQQGTSTDPFAGISAGRLGQAQRFADAGMFGRAKQQIGLGGGNWDDVGGLLRQQAGETDNYGGDWNWGGASDADVAQAQRFANAGMMGRASGMFGDNWNKQMHTQLQAERKANPYVKGSSMGFDWGDATAGRLAKAKEFATAGKMGRAKQMYEKGGGKWSPGIGNQFRAWAKGNK